MAGNNRIVFEIGVKNASDMASKSQQAGQQSGQQFAKGFQVGAGTKQLLSKMGGSQLDAFFKANPAVRDALAQEYMASKGLLDPKTQFASAGGQEFPIEKRAQKFGAAARQMRQAMSELNPALKEFKRLMGESAKLDPNLIGQFHTKGGSGGMLSDPAVAAGVKRALSMGALNTGQKSIILPSDEYLRRGAKSLQSMGELRTGPNWKMAGMGAIAGAFSPWIGARMLSEAFSKEGGGGGRSGMLKRVVFGGSGEFGFAEFFTILKGIKLAFGLFLNMLNHVVEQGSRVYQTSARMGISGANVARMQGMFTAVGINPDVAFRMMTQARMGSRRGGVFESVDGMAMRAQLSGAALEDVQQIRNMSAELKYLSIRMSFASYIIGDTSGAMQRINMDFSVFKMQWSAAFAQFIADGEGFIRVVINIGTALGIIATALAKAAQYIPIPGIGLSPDMINKALNPTGVGNGPGSSILSTGQAHNATGGNPFARIGFTFGNFGANDYVRQTAQNTKRIADAVTRGGGSRGGWDLPVFNANMP